MLADEGYYSSLELKACEDDGITACVPVAGGPPAKQGRFSLKDFARLTPPLTPTLVRPANCCIRWRGAGRTQVAASRSAMRAAGRPAGRVGYVHVALSPKASRRTIGRWEHEDVLERHRARMLDAGELMRRRSAIVEHPFGTLKCRAPATAALPGSGLRQGARRMEPDGALLQSHARPQYPGLRRLRRGHRQSIPIALAVDRPRKAVSSSFSKHYGQICPCGSRSGASASTPSDDGALLARPRRANPERILSAPVRKIFAFVFGRNRIRADHPSHRGAFLDRHGRWSRMRWTQQRRRALPDERALKQYGEVVWSDTPSLVSSCAGVICAAATVATKRVTGESSLISRKTIAQGRPDCLR